MIGLGVMGENLALNVERNGFPIAVWNRRADAVDAFVNGRGAGKNVVGAHSPAELAAAMERPRRIMMLVKAGEAVDWTIDQMKPYLDKGDIIIDGGNSWFEDTERRDAALTEEGLNFIGSGVSGGEKGALWGPSLMPGGEKDAYEIDPPDLGGDRREGRRRPVRHCMRPRRRRPLREDGPQRHRVRRHAADRRGLRHHAQRPRPRRRRRWPTSSTSGTRASSTRSSSRSRRRSSA